MEKYTTRGKLERIPVVFGEEPERKWRVTVRPDATEEETLRLKTWLKEPTDKATGKPQRDDKNADPTLRTRPVMGISLFINMQPAGPNKWAGRIYNADDGKTYESSVTMVSSGTLNVRGCMGTLCAGEDWTR